MVSMRVTLNDRLNDVVNVVRGVLMDNLAMCESQKGPRSKMHHCAHLSLVDNLVRVLTM